MWDQEHYMKTFKRLGIKVTRPARGAEGWRVGDADHGIEHTGNKGTAVNAFLNQFYEMRNKRWEKKAE
jgi:hypothetical protein